MSIVCYNCQMVRKNMIVPVHFLISNIVQYIVFNSFFIDFIFSLEMIGDEKL